jgi:8-oxo-dGTP diphosphatase
MVSHCSSATPRGDSLASDGIASLAMPTQIVVAGAIISGSTLLVAQRVRPPELAGRWELPGGKVGPGETERDALARELAEELGLEVADVAVGERLGDDIPLNDTTTLRAYRVRLVRGEPHARDHQALRWVTAAELHRVDWVPADRGWLKDLTQAF